VKNIDRYVSLAVIAALLAINILGFVIAAVDKYKARRRRWRIPERTFFILALFCGSAGVYLGLLMFRHKTRHWYFMLGIPAILAAQILTACFLYYRFQV
jgi:uncharacterized membrane protein YsdA (DUF1294 family)